MKEREAWRAAVHGVTKSQTRLSDWTTTAIIQYCFCQARPKKHWSFLKSTPETTHKWELVAVATGTASQFPDQTVWQAINSRVEGLVSRFHTCLSMAEAAGALVGQSYRDALGVKDRAAPSACPGPSTVHTPRVPVTELTPRPRRRELLTGWRNMERTNRPSDFTPHLMPHAHLCLLKSNSPSKLSQTLHPPGTLPRGILEVLSPVTPPASFWFLPLSRWDTHLPL